MLIFAYKWIFLLLPLPILVRWLLPPHREIEPAVRIPGFQQIVEGTGQKPSSGAVVRRRTLIQVVFYVIVWCAAVVALARPQWLEPPIVKEIPTRDLLLAIDLSGSMETEDFKDKEGQTVDRLTAAKEVLDDFLSRRKGDRVGIIVFGTAAFVQVPFTQDLDVWRQLIQETAVRMAGPKTAMGDAIGLGINLFERSDVKERVMIVLTDGNDTGSRVPPQEAAQIASDKSITIYTVAVGDPTTTGEEKLDKEALKKVAETTGGSYFFAADRNELDGIYSELDRIKTRKVETISYRPRQDLFHWLLALVLLVSLSYHLPIAILSRRRSFSRN